MFLSQSMVEYMENPMGKGSTALGNRALVKKDLDDRYNKLLDRYKDFKHFQYAKGNVFYIHILIPSESKRENTYDVIIELTPPEDSTGEKTLKNYDFRVFSNCPSFVYTYAYVYNQYGLLIPEFTSKYNDITLDTAPGTKNPGEIINYEKSIYFACKYITSHHSLMTILLLLPQCKPFNSEYMSRTIRNSDRIMLEIKKENDKLKEAEKARIKQHRVSGKYTMDDVNAVAKDIRRLKYSGKAKQMQTQHALSKIQPKPKLRPRAKIKPK